MQQNKNAKLATNNFEAVKLQKNGDKFDVRKSCIESKMLNADACEHNSTSLANVGNKHIRQCFAGCITCFIIFNEK